MEVHNWVQNRRTFTRRISRHFITCTVQAKTVENVNQECNSLCTMGNVVTHETYYIIKQQYE